MYVDFHISKYTCIFQSTIVDAMTLFVPNLLSPLVNKINGVLIPPWNSFFQQFSNPPSPIQPVVVGASPFNYTAKVPGTLIIAGGVSSTVFTRGKDTVTVTGGVFPMEIKDTLTIGYGAAPVINFIPRY